MHVPLPSKPAGALGPKAMYSKFFSKKKGSCYY